MNYKRVIAVLLMVWTQAMAEQTEYTSIVFLAKLCSWRQSRNRTQFSTFYTQDFSRMLWKCTKQNIVMSKNPAKNIVVDIDIPCTFQSINTKDSIIDNRLLNITNTFDYVVEWMDYALDKVNKSLGIKVNDFMHKLMVMPNTNGVIPWRGLGQIGGMYSWYNTVELDVEVYIHEIGHNFGFGHAMMNGDEYGDDTCVMGHGHNCFASPHRHYMMWDKPMMAFNWVAHQASIAYWNTTLVLKNDGEYVVLNSNLYIEATINNVNVYLLQSNMSTSRLCQINEVERFCNINIYNLSMALNGNDNEAYYIAIHTGYDVNYNNTQILRKRTNTSSAASTLLQIYECVCMSFVAYNIIMFIVAIL